MIVMLLFSECLLLGSTRVNQVAHTAAAAGKSIMRLNKLHQTNRYVIFITANIKLLFFRASSGTI